MEHLRFTGEVRIALGFEGWRGLNSARKQGGKGGRWPCGRRGTPGKPAEKRKVHAGYSGVGLRKDRQITQDQNKS